MAFVCGLGLLLVSSWFAQYELEAIAHPLSYVGFVALLALAAIAIRWQSSASARDEGPTVEFEDKLPPAVQTLGLNRDGTVPLPRT